jgi:hypothetical protein
MLRTVVFALTLNPSPYLGQGQLCGSPSPKFGRRGWGMRVYFFSYRKNYSFQGGRGLIYIYLTNLNLIKSIFHLASGNNSKFLLTKKGKTRYTSTLFKVY